MVLTRAADHSAQTRSQRFPHRLPRYLDPLFRVQIFQPVHAVYEEAGIAEVEFLEMAAQGADFAGVQSAGNRLRDIGRIKLEVATPLRQLYRGAADKTTIVAFLESCGFALTEVEPQLHGQEENLTFVVASLKNSPEHVRGLAGAT